MKTIWKFELETKDAQEIHIPENAQFLTMMTQMEVPCLWYLVDDSVPTIPTMFRIYGTGHSIKHNSKKDYIGGYQLQGGSFIGHVFIEK